METLTKELKITIAMVGACLSLAFVSLVALFVRVGDMDKLGTSVLMLVLVAFVAVGSAVIVDEYKNEERAQIARTTYDTIAELCNEIDELNAVREMRDEYADTLASMEANYRDECYNTKRLSAEVQTLRENYQILRARYEAQTMRYDQVSEELDELRYTVKAERERVADI